MLLDLVTLSNNDFPLSKPEFPSISPTKDLPAGFLSGAGLRLLHRKGYRRAFSSFRLRRKYGRSPPAVERACERQGLCGGPSLRRAR